MTSKHIRILAAATSASILIALSGIATLASAANAPSVASIAPTTGGIAGGTTVTITGTGLTGASAVNFGGMPATNFTASSTATDTSLTAIAPATSTAGVVDVTVTTGNGTSTTGAFDRFTYTAPATPTVSAISPTTGSTAGGTAVTITGTGLTGASAVHFGGTSAAITATTSDTSMTVTAPATSTAGIVDVTVTTPNGTSATGASDKFTYTSPVATTSPVISNLSVSNIRTSTATINWQTDLPASSQVFYGTSANYGSTSTLDMTPATTHAVVLSGLTQATLYHFKASSGNAVGTTTSADMTFDSASTASTTPLAVTGIDTIKGSATADGTFADGWQWVLHFVVPSVENVFSMKFADFFSSSSSSTIPAAGNIEFYSPQASDASTSASAIVESGNGYGTNIHLSGDTSTSTPGRQVDLYVNVAVPSGTPTGTYTTTFGAMSTTTP